MGFHSLYNIAVNRVYNYPQWVKEVSQEGMEDKWVVLKLLYRAYAMFQWDAALCTPRHKLSTHANDTTADENELV
jgi:hypothetical protein